MRRNSKYRIVRIVFTIGLLIYAFYQTHLFTSEGWKNLLAAISGVDPVYFSFSMLIGVLIIVASGLKWHMLARARGLRVRFWRINAYYAMGMFFNLCLPSSVGGDVVRMHQLGKYTERHADAAASVFVERFTGLVTLIFLALIAVVLNLRLFNLPWLTTGLGIAIAGAAVAIWLILDVRPRAFLLQYFGNWIPSLQPFLEKIEKFHMAVLDYRQSSRALGYAFINSMVFHVLAVANVWASARVFGPDLSITNAVIAVPVILLITNFPISVGGIGVMEFSYTFTLTLLGVSPAVAISTALLMRFKSVFFAGIGGILYAAMDNQCSIADSLQTRSETASYLPEMQVRDAKNNSSASFSKF